MLCVGDFFGSDLSAWEPYKSGKVKGQNVFWKPLILLLNKAKESFSLIVVDSIVHIDILLTQI